MARGGVGRRGRVVALSILSVVLVAVSAVLSHPRPSDRESEEARLRGVVELHDTLMGKWLSAVADTVSNPATRTFPQSLATDYSLYVYGGDELRLWHNACLPQATPSLSLFDGRMVVADNGWYYVKTMRRGPTTLVALLRIRSHFPYENDYLSDHYHPSFALPAGAGISTLRADGPQVSAPDGSFLFTVVGDRLSSARVTPSSSPLAAILMLLGVGAALCAISGAAQALARRHGAWLPLTLSAALLCGLYAACLGLAPHETSPSLFIFSLQEFSYDWWMPSLGYLVLASFVVLTWAVIFFRTVRIRTRRKLGVAVASLAPPLVFLASYALIDIMARHSQGLSFYVGHTSLSAPALTRIGILSLLLMSIVLVTERCYSSVSTTLRPRGFALVAMGSSALVWATAHVADWSAPWMLTLAFAALITSFYAMKRHSPLKMPFSHFVWTLTLLAVMTTLRLTSLNIDKEHAYRHLLAENLTYQIMSGRDPIAEQLLHDVQASLRADTTLHDLVASGSAAQEQILNHIRKRHFPGYLSHFDIQAVPCRGDGSTIQMTNTGDVYACLPYFQHLIDKRGTRVANADLFYHIDEDDGRPCYLGIVSFGGAPRSSPDFLIVQLTLRVATQGVGYPELLVNKRDAMDDNKLRGYSYAKYVDGRLSVRYGAYDYPLTMASAPTGDAMAETSEGGFSHLTISPSPRQSIVVSHPEMGLLDLLSSFSYLFLGMLVASSAVMLAACHSHKSVWTHSGISDRLHAGLVSFAMLLFVVLCALSSLQSMNEFEHANRVRLSDAMQGVLTTLSDTFSATDIADAGSDPDLRMELDHTLRRSADAFSADAHFFSPDGRLVGSSRRELFANGLAAPLMNDAALDILDGGGNEAFVQERIGTLVHYSIYSPLLNEQGRLMGYVNVPLFSDVVAMRRQMVSTLMPITNSMMLIVFLAVIFSYAIAHGITRSLTQLRDVLQQADIGKRGVRLSYPYDDEVGRIVTAYNKMTRQLAESAERLAATERESTWREMARQVAHEIKNPLTPMKLSVQYLLRVWDSRRESFEPMLRKTARTLTEQIDQLASVASQFSNVAKTKQAEPQAMDIAARLSSICSLFGNESQSALTYTGPAEGVTAWADPDLITSALNNLIKNAQQSAKDGRRVNIGVTLAAGPSQVTISVADDGDGIADEAREKIFRPNFTTKSTGMGLGLAITKAIVTSSGGQISFETAVGRGTTFTIVLPAAKKEKAARDTSRAARTAKRN